MRISVLPWIYGAAGSLGWPSVPLPCTMYTPPTIGRHSQPLTPLGVAVQSQCCTTNQADAQVPPVSFCSSNMSALAHSHPPHVFTAAHLPLAVTALTSLLLL